MGRQYIDYLILKKTFLLKTWILQTEEESLEEYLNTNDRTPDILLNIIIKKTNVRGYFYKIPNCSK